MSLQVISVLRRAINEPTSLQPLGLTCFLNSETYDTLIINQSPILALDWDKSLVC